MEQTNAIDFVVLNDEALEYLDNCASLAYESDKDTMEFVRMANPTMVRNMVAKIRELRSYIENYGFNENY